MRATEHQLDSEGGPATQRLQAARLRAAEERRNRVRKALRHVDDQSRIKFGTEEREKTRASTTDPECRVMKMADGGFRPAYILHFATDVEGQVIVGVQVTNKGSDMAELEPMLAEIGRRTEKWPQEHLVDGGYVKVEAIDRAAERDVKVYAPAQGARRADIDSTKAKR